MTTDALESNENKTCSKNDLGGVLFEHQQELLNDSVSSGDEDFRCANVSPPPSEQPSNLCSQMATDTKDQNEPKTDAENALSITDKTNASLITYNREELVLIRKSKTEVEWLSYLRLIHGHHWLIERIPFQLDHTLRCSFGQQLRVLREREENLKQNKAGTECRQRRRKNFGKNNNENSRNAYATEPMRKIMENNLNTSDIPTKKDKETKTAQVESPVSVQADGLPPFTDLQISVWLKYLSCVNLRIKEAIEGA